MCWLNLENMARRRYKTSDDSHWSHLYLELIDFDDVKFSELFETSNQRNALGYIAAAVRTTHDANTYVVSTLNVDAHLPHQAHRQNCHSELD